MPPFAYPLVNGMFHDYSSIELNVGVNRFTGVKSINYSDSLEPGLVRGTAAPVIGRTRGQYDAEGSLEMYLQDFDALVQALVFSSGGLGYMEAAFDILVNYVPVGLLTYQTRLIRGARIKKADDSHQSGSDALTTKIDFHALYIIRNNVPPLGIATP